MDLVNERQGERLVSLQCAIKMSEPARMRAKPCISSPAGHILPYEALWETACLLLLKGISLDTNFIVC